MMDTTVVMGMAETAFSVFVRFSFTASFWFEDCVKENLELVRLYTIWKLLYIYVDRTEDRSHINLHVSHSSYTEIPRCVLKHRRNLCLRWHRVTWLNNWVTFFTCSQVYYTLFEKKNQHRMLFILPRNFLYQGNYTDCSTSILCPRRETRGYYINTRTSRHAYTSWNFRHNAQGATGDHTSATQQPDL